MVASVIVLYMYCACWRDLDPIQGQGHGVYEFLKIVLFFVCLGDRRRKLQISENRAPPPFGCGGDDRQPPSGAILVIFIISLYIKCGKMSVHTYDCNAEHGQLSIEWRHNENDVIMIIAGLVADGPSRRYRDWWHVAMDYTALLFVNICG